MKLIEAQEKIARLIVQKYRLNDQCVSLYDDRKAKGEPADTLNEEQARLYQALTVATNECDEFAQECAADPMLSPYMLPWMMEIQGPSDLSYNPKMSESAYRDLQEQMKDHEKFAGTVGGLMPSVLAAVKENHFWIREMLVAEGRWVLGCPVDEIESGMLVHLIHTRFAKAMTSGMLTMRRRFHGWRFRGVYDRHDAANFLERLTTKKLQDDADEVDETDDWTGR